MSLFIHEIIHVALSFLVFFAVWKLSRQTSSIKHLASIILSSLIGGVLVDLDHLVEYFLAFGLQFRPDYFLKGYQFLKLDKLYVPFHSWELVFLLFMLIFVLSRIFHLGSRIKLSVLSFTLALFFHILVDTATNHVTLQGYSFLYRARYNFDIKYLVDPAHYQNHLKLKSTTKFQ
jgi:hypothetical protein